MLSKNRLMLAIILMSASHIAFSAQTYKHTDANGNIAYSDKPIPSVTPKQINIRSQPLGAEDDPVKASIMVYTQEVIVETSYRFCRDHISSTETSVTLAKNKWQTAHKTLSDKKNILLHDKLTDVELRKLAAQTERDNEGVLQTLARAPYPEQLKMCTNAPARYFSGEMNMMAHPKLVNTIMNYKPTKPAN